MPCLQHNRKPKEPARLHSSIDKRLQKSTTDSEEKDKIGGELTKPQQPVPKMKRPMKSPKIKPNYGTKAGGMMLKKLTLQRGFTWGSRSGCLTTRNSKGTKKIDFTKPKPENTKLMSIKEHSSSLSKTQKKSTMKNSKSMEKEKSKKSKEMSSNSHKNSKSRSLKIIEEMKMQAPVENWIEKPEEPNDQPEDSLLYQKEFLEDCNLFIQNDARPSFISNDVSKPDINDDMEVISLLGDLDEKTSELEDPFAMGTENILQEVHDEMIQRSISKISLIKRNSMEQSAIDSMVLGSKEENKIADKEKDQKEKIGYFEGD